MLYGKFQWLYGVPCEIKVNCDMSVIWNTAISGYDLVISVNELLVDVNQFLLLVN